MTPTDPELVARLRRELAHGIIAYQDTVDLLAALEAAEARAQQLEAALKALIARWLATAKHTDEHRRCNLEICADQLWDVVWDGAVRADTQEPTPAPKLIERVDWSSVSYQVSSICEARTPGHRCWRTAGHTGDHDWVLTEEKPTP